MDVSSRTRSCYKVVRIRHDNESPTSVGQLSNVNKMDGRILEDFRGLREVASPPSSMTSMVENPEPAYRSQWLDPNVEHQGLPVGNLHKVYFWGFQ